MAFLDEGGLKTLWTVITNKLSGKSDTGHGHSAATSSVAGFMSAADKSKLDGIASGANKITVDGSLSASSTNPVQNKVVNTAITNLNTLVGSKAVSTQISEAITAKAGKANGLATLDTNGKVPSSQLPSYVDDVIEGYFSSSKFYSTKNSDGTYAGEIVGETGKIYTDLNTNKVYRWSGSAYTVISETLALGTTSSTAFRGDYGQTAYNHAVAKGSAFNSGLYKITTNAQGHVTAATAVTKSDITALGIPGQDTNTTYGVFGAATASVGGSSGLVPAPASGKQGQYLRGDGTWATPTNTTYSAATTSAAGLMSANDKAKLEGIASGANKYTHPGYTAKTSGLYKVTVDAQGHVSAATAVTKSDITALGIPGQDTNTTYGVFKGASSSAGGSTGLVTAPTQGQQGLYLRGDGTWATPTNTTYGVASASSNGLMSSGDKSKLDGIRALTNDEINAICI